MHSLVRAVAWSFACLFLSHADGAIEWSDPVTADASTNVGLYASLALSSDGSPKVAYYDSNNGDLLYAWRDDAKVWHVSTVDSTGDVGQYSALALGSDGQPRIAYYDVTNGNLKYASFNGSSWSVSTVDSSGDVGGHCSLALDPSDDPHMAYHDASNTNLKYATRSGASWSTMDIDLTGQISLLGEYTSIAVDPYFGFPHIAYCDYVLGDVKHAWYNGIFWQYETVQSTGYVGYYTSIKVDSLGYPHLSFCDPVGGILYYAKKPGNNWVVEQVDVGGVLSPSGYYSSLALNRSNDPTIAYCYYDMFDPQIRLARYSEGQWVIEDVFSSGYHYPSYCSLQLDVLGNPFIAYAEGFFEWRLDTIEGRLPPPTKGWAIIDSASPLAGMEIYGNEASGGITAIPMSIDPSRMFIFPHFHCSATWYTGLAMVNPDETLPATILLTAFSDFGSILGQQTVTLTPGQKVSYTVSDLFGITGTGWILVASDVGIMAQEVYGNLKNGGHGAVEPISAGNILYFPHFRTNAKWWTGIAIANPNIMDTMALLTAYDSDGTPLSQGFMSIPALGKVAGFVKDIFGFSDAQGWIEISSILPVAALAIITDSLSSPMDFAAVAPAELSSTLISPTFFEDGNWWTGLALGNPNGTPNSVVMTAYRSDGVLLGEKTTLLPAFGRTVSSVKGLFPSAYPGAGWIQVKGDSNLAGLHLLGIDDGVNKGLAGMGFQKTTATRLYAPHYHMDSSWWTVFALTNPNANAAVAKIYGYDVDGLWGNYAEKTLPGHGNMIGYVDNLFID